MILSYCSKENPEKSILDGPPSVESLKLHILIERGTVLITGPLMIYALYHFTFVVGMSGISPEYFIAGLGISVIVFAKLQVLFNSHYSPELKINKILDLREINDHVDIYLASISAQGRRLTKYEFQMIQEYLQSIKDAELNSSKKTDIQAKEALIYASVEQHDVERTT